MARKKKVTTYVDEDLLRSVKALAARNNGRIYEVFNEALKRYLEEVDAVEPPLAKPSLSEAFSDQRTRLQSETSDEEVVESTEGETLFEAVVVEREERDY